MKKVFKVEVDCAMCAQKCEEAIKKLDVIKDCQINFMTQKMTIEADDMDVALKQAIKAAQKIEPDFEVEE